MKKTLSALRINEQTNSNMNSALKKLNEKQLFPLTLNQFRRLAYELLSQIILQDKPIPIKLQM